MRTRVTVVSLSVSASVFLSVPHSSASLGRVCNELNLQARSLLHSESFQLMDFVKKLSSQVIACSSFGIAKRSAICI